MTMKKIFIALFFLNLSSTCYCQHIEAYSERIEAYNKSAIEKLDLKDYEGAVVEITKIMEIKPNDSMAYFDRGLIKNDFIKDYIGAIADFTEAIRINGSNVNAYYYRGLAKYHLKN